MKLQSLPKVEIISDWDQLKNKHNPYKSKHDPKLLPTASTFIISNTNHPSFSNINGSLTLDQIKNNKSSLSYIQKESTFGPKASPRYDPESRKRYKLKSNRIPTLKELKHEHPENFVVTNKKPRCKPFLDNLFPIKQSQLNKDFIKQNYENAYKIRSWNENKGATLKKIEIKDFLKKSDYGKIPKYLAKLGKLQKDTQPSKESDNSYQNKNGEPLKNSQVEGEFGEKHENGGALSENEKKAVLIHLKEKWKKVNFEYQKSTHYNMIRSLKQAKRKIELEQNLDEIEKCIYDIEKLIAAKV